MEWLFWQTGNQGPMAGQLSHFHNYAPEGQEYSLKRYRGETERNLAVLERRLEDRDYILERILPSPTCRRFPGRSFRSRSASRWSRSRASRTGAAGSRSARRCGAPSTCTRTGRTAARTNAQNNSLLYNQTAEHLRGRG